MVHEQVNRAHKKRTHPEMTETEADQLDEYSGQALKERTFSKLERGRASYNGHRNLRRKLTPTTRLNLGCPHTTSDITKQPLRWDAVNDDDDEGTLEELNQAEAAGSDGDEYNSAADDSSDQDEAYETGSESSSESESLAATESESDVDDEQKTK